MQLHIFPGLNDLSVAVADWMVETIKTTLQHKNRCTLVLSGGNTPKKLNALLCSPAYIDKIDWAKVHIFFGDERFVPLNDERNNAKLALDTLLHHVPVLKQNIHIMRTEGISPEDAAAAYETIIESYFPSHAEGEVNSFDLVLLGMGDDGHTLSLFPGKTDVIDETKKLCTWLWLQAQDMYRVTLTHPIVNKAANIAFLTNGSGKAAALQQVLKGSYQPNLYPSQIIQPVNGQLHWFVDEAAAALL
jgi:6-phosphogluconolactonase